MSDESEELKKDIEAYEEREKLKEPKEAIDMNALAKLFW